MALKVGIVGAGGVGATLGSTLLRTPAQFAVKYGSRDPTSDKVKAVLAKQPGATADTVENTVNWSDAVILALPGATTVEGNQKYAASLGPGIKGKVLIDVTNPLTTYPELDLPWGLGKSAGEIIAEALPGTPVFKIFNTVPDVAMANADGSLITGEQLVMLYVGPKDQGRDVAEKVITGVGFKPAYLGPIRYARNLEAIAELYCHLTIPGVGTAEKFSRNIHFQLITDTDKASTKP